MHKVTSDEDSVLFYFSYNEKQIYKEGLNKVNESLNILIDWSFDHQYKIQPKKPIFPLKSKSGRKNLTYFPNDYWILEYL